MSLSKEELDATLQKLTRMRTNDARNGGEDEDHGGGHTDAAAEHAN